MFHKIIFGIVGLLLFSCSSGEKSGTECCKNENTIASSEQNIQIDHQDTLSNSGTILNTSKITCPHCGFSKSEIMPTEICQLSYKCTKCGHEMHPKNGDCCVFCTYGDHKCPSKQ